MNEKKSSSFKISDSLALVSYFYWYFTEFDIQLQTISTGNNQVRDMPHAPHSYVAKNAMNAFKSKGRAPSDATNSSLPGSSTSNTNAVNPF